MKKRIPGYIPVLLIAASWFIFCPAGCTTSKKAIDTIVFDTTVFGGFTPNESISVESVTIDYYRDHPRSNYPTEEILLALGKHHGIELTGAEDDSRYYLSLLIQENRFTRNLDSLSSVTAIATVRESKRNHMVVKLIYSEESPATIESYYHLYSILDEIMETLAYELDTKR